MWLMSIHPSMCRTHRWTWFMMPYWMMGMIRSHIPPGSKSIPEMFWRGPVNEEGKTKDVRQPSTMAGPCCWHSTRESGSSIFSSVLLSGSQSRVERNDRIGSPGNQKWGTHHCCYLQWNISGTMWYKKEIWNCLWIMKRNKLNSSLQVTARQPLSYFDYFIHF